MAESVRLRVVEDADLPLFFAHQNDRASNDLAGVPARPQDDFDAHWRKIRADSTVLLRTIVSGQGVAGYVGSFIREEKREVCYWLDRKAWGRGIASKALADFLKQDQRRPLFARVSQENKASIRVLAKCGFALLGEEIFKDREGREDVGHMFILAVGRNP